MLSILLPLIGVATLGNQPAAIVTGSHEVVEQALNQGVRARIGANWAIVDIRIASDDFIVTLQRNGDVEHHVVHLADQESYRVVSDATLPADPVEPDDFTLRALAAPRGGIEITSSCGDYYHLPYVIEDTAAGEFAGVMVARTLAAADDLQSATVSDDRATFVIEKAGHRLDLRVALDPKGNVIEAELRRFQLDADDWVAYNRMPAMKAALRNARVVSIAVKSKRSLTLGTSKGRFLIDPHGDAFTYGVKYGDPNEEGEGDDCGC